MSWNLSVVGKGKDAVKSALAERNEQEGSRMPKSVSEAIDKLIDEMPDTNMDGFNTISVATYGHYRPDEEGAGGTSNLQISIQQVADAD